MDRLRGVDAARGLAVLGMAAVHVLPGTDDDGATTLSDTIASGRSSAAFAVLAGVGVALAMRGGTGWRARLALLLRALLIGALGLALGHLDSGVIVILAYYAAFFVLLLPFLGWPPRRLLVAAAAVALLAPVGQFLVGSDLPTLDEDGPTYAQLADPGELLSGLLLTGTYPAVPWAAYLLTGLAVGRLALHRTATAVRLALTGAGLAVGAAVTSALLLGPLGGYDALDVPRRTVDAGRGGSVPDDSWWWLAVDARHSSTTPDLVATTGTALLALGLCLLLARCAGRLVTPLAAVGSMPLSLYAAHVCFLSVTNPVELLPYYLLQVATALLVAPLWRRFLGRGPLEALLAATTRRVRGAT